VTLTLSTPTGGATLGTTKTALLTIVDDEPANPVPALTTLAPASATAGGPAFTLTVNGSSFVSSSVVQWNGAARTTTFVSNRQLTAAIPAGDIAANGTAQVTVRNPAPGGGTSNALTFTINRLFTLNVSKTGNGTVTSTPAGIQCGADCSEAYPNGTVVTLTVVRGRG
jgi:IPT/TIG domain-containing protein